MGKEGCKRLSFAPGCLQEGFPCVVRRRWHAEAQVAFPGPEVCSKSTSASPRSFVNKLRLRPPPNLNHMPEREVENKI